MHNSIHVMAVFHGFDLIIILFLDTIIFRFKFNRLCIWVLMRAAILVVILSSRVVCWWQTGLSCYYNFSWCRSCIGNQQFVAVRILLNDICGFQANRRGRRVQVEMLRLQKYAMICFIYLEHLIYLNLIRNHTRNLLYTIPGQLSDVDQLGNLRTFCQYLLFLINWKVSQMTLDHWCLETWMKMK